MQHTSLSPDRKVVVIVGDDPDGLLIDSNTGKVCHYIKSRLNSYKDMFGTAPV